MSLQDILAILSGGAVGAILAVIGGGGSILATPLLLYVVGVAQPHIAIGTSALAVSVSAFANFITHARQGHVRWRCALTFAGGGVLGALIGATIGKMTDARVLLPLFALVMALVGVMMLRPRTAPENFDAQVTAANTPQIVATGGGVGLVSGFFGIGGGFLVVPGLIVCTGMGMVHAVGSSLFAVGVFGATTAVSYAADGLIDWRIAGLFIGGGVLGGIGGVQVCKRLSKERGLLQRTFAIVVFAMAAYVLWRSLAD